MSATRQRIIEILETKGEASAADIGQALNDLTVNPRGVLRRLEADGEIVRVGYSPARDLHGNAVGGPRSSIWALASE